MRPWAGMCSTSRTVTPTLLGLRSAIEAAKKDPRPSMIKVGACSGNMQAFSTCVLRRCSQSSERPENSLRQVMSGLRAVLISTG